MEFSGHKFGITNVSFSPNGKYLVSVGTQHDMVANVWNWKHGTKVASNKISSKVSIAAPHSYGQRDAEVSTISLSPLLPTGEQHGLLSGQ